jgi:hypothetical protein
VADAAFAQLLAGVRNDPCADSASAHRLGDTDRSDFAGLLAKETSPQLWPTGSK